VTVGSPAVALCLRSDSANIHTILIQILSTVNYHQVSDDFHSSFMTNLVSSFTNCQNCKFRKQCVLDN